MIKPSQTENFFRHQYGKLVATLTKRVGIQFLALIEDSVQTALLKGLEKWSQTPIKKSQISQSALPSNPSAWLYKVATNCLLDELKQNANQQRLLNENLSQLIEDLEVRNSTPSLDGFNDDLLHLLFHACHPEIATDSQLVFALRLICGFNNQEIASRLFISEENAYKRFSRARKKLQQVSPSIKELTSNDIVERIPVVNKVLYLLFTEGYLSLNHNQSIRKELCCEALRLCLLVAEFITKQSTKVTELHLVNHSSQTYALVALMYFHQARLIARQDSSGGLLLLEEQDRSLWNNNDIFNGFKWLEKSSVGNFFSRYHAEAGIAAEHSLAKSYDSTRWQQIAEIYQVLEQQSPSAIHRLNHAVVISEWKGPQAALEFLNLLKPPNWLLSSFMWSAVLADLHRQNGEVELASQYKVQASESAPNEEIAGMLLRRLDISNKH